MKGKIGREYAVDLGAHIQFKRETRNTPKQNHERWESRMSHGIASGESEQHRERETLFSGPFSVFVFRVPSTPSFQLTGRQ